jgi:hypothetical protein
MVKISTTSSNIKQTLHPSQAVYLCVLRNCKYKQWRFLCRDLTWSVYYETRTKYLNIVCENFMLETGKTHLTESSNQLLKLLCQLFFFFKSATKMSCILHDETFRQTYVLFKCSWLLQSTNTDFSSTGWVTGRVAVMNMHEVKAPLEERLPARALNKQHSKWHDKHTSQLACKLNLTTYIGSFFYGFEANAK